MRMIVLGCLLLSGCHGLVALQHDLGGPTCTKVPPDQKVCVFTEKRK